MTWSSCRGCRATWRFLLPGSATLRSHLAPTAASYEGLVGKWQLEATGRRLRTGVQVDDSLRSFVREQPENGLGRALLASRRAYATSVHALVAAGVRPQDLRPRDDMARLAAQAWERAETDVGALGAPRDLMWVDQRGAGRGHEPNARSGSRLDCAPRLTPRSATRAHGARTIVHHGFYFYTAPQWQMFQALRSLEEVDQVFVVHDDGRNPAFASWRYYFRPEWGMPVPAATTGRESGTDAVTPRCCLASRCVDWRSERCSGGRPPDGVPEPGRPRPALGPGERGELGRR